MKSKAPLVMMEQMVMILVFALAAALCLQAFVLSNSLSEQGQARDQALWPIMTKPGSKHRHPLFTGWR